MFSPRRVVAVARKEWQEILRNWLGLLLVIIAPISTYFLFAYGMPLDVKNIPMVLLDEDKSHYSRQFADTFQNSHTFRIIKKVDSYEEAEYIMRKGIVRLYVVIPPKFGRSIEQGKPQSVQAIVDATYTNRASLIGGYIDATVAAFNENVLAKYFIKKYGSAGAGTPPVSMYMAPWFNPTMRSEEFIVPGVIAIVLIFLPPIIVAISLTKEKETGSIINMYCSPLSKLEYLTGKLIPYIIITYINFVVYLILTVTIFSVPLRGSLMLLLMVSAIYVVSVLVIGLFIGVLVRSQISAILICAIVTLLPSFMYSGFMIPIECLGPNAQSTANMFPATYYIDFIRKLMIKGVGIEYLAGDIFSLIFSVVLLFGLSVVLFKKRLG
ncbi:MAG: ABC transporter permease [Armatimonadota bacterium]